MSVFFPRCLVELSTILVPSVTVPRLASIDAPYKTNHLTEILNRPLINEPPRFLTSPSSIKQSYQSTDPSFPIVDDKKELILRQASEINHHYTGLTYDTCQIMVALPPIT
jgi:hypothetical protein